MSEFIESTVNAEPVVNVEPQIETEQVETTNEPVNAGSEEVAPSQVEEKPVQSAEENAKFAQVRREAEQKAYQKAQDELIASMYGESHGIYTKADYDKAVEAERERERLAKVAEEEKVPEHVAQEILEARTIKEQVAKEKFEANDRVGFLDWFKSQNDRDFVVGKDAMPPEVWEQGELYAKSMGKQGQPLKYAYMEWQMAKIKEGQATKQKNAENAEVSTGSVKGKLDIGNDHITADVFETNKNDANWVKKNFTKIMESRAKW